MQTRLNKTIDSYLNKEGIKLHKFQLDIIQKFKNIETALVLAPTGSGKTYSVWLPILSEMFELLISSTKNTKSGFNVIWLTPLKSLTKDIADSLNETVSRLRKYNHKLPQILIETRTADTPTYRKQKQLVNTPHVLVTTPESLQVLIANDSSQNLAKSIRHIVVDEIHEIFASKRGILLELGLRYLENQQPKLKLWGLSATVGQPEKLAQQLAGRRNCFHIFNAEIASNTRIEILVPDSIPILGWRGYLGLKLLDKLVETIVSENCTLIFTNTRAQSEIWYREIIKKYPEFIGKIAVHHGSLASETRMWVEQHLKKGGLKAVVCTSSLDLGLDFRPISAVVQIGNPKSVSRLLQRAGRSNHQPGKTNKVYLIPTNSLELFEFLALELAVVSKSIESLKNYQQPVDVLAQFLQTMASADQLPEDITQLASMIKKTYTYQNISVNWLLEISQFLKYGGKSLEKYEQYHKFVVKDSLLKFSSRSLQTLHKYNIGTIVSTPMLIVKFQNGKTLGQIEESQLANLANGSRFYFAGIDLEVIKTNGKDLIVRKAMSKASRTLVYQGGNIDLSSEFAKHLRDILTVIQSRASFASKVSTKKPPNQLPDQLTNDTDVKEPTNNYSRNMTSQDNISKIIDHRQPILTKLESLMKSQTQNSNIPTGNNLLFELYKDKNQKNIIHLFVYPLWNRRYHQLLANTLAFRLTQNNEMSTTLTANNHGFNLSISTEIEIDEFFNRFQIRKNLLTYPTKQEFARIVNKTGYTQRKFREVAAISGLIYANNPKLAGKHKSLERNTNLIYKLFTEFDPEHILLKEAAKQAFDEAIGGETQFKEFYSDLQQREIQLQYISQLTPWSLPLLVEKLRSQVSSQSLEAKLIEFLNKQEISANVSALI